MTIIDDVIDAFIRLATRDLQLSKLKECSNCNDTIYWASDHCKPVYESSGKLICYTCSDNKILGVASECRVANTFMASEFNKIIESREFKQFINHYNDKYNRTTFWSKSVYEFSEENRQLISALSQEQDEKRELLHALSQEHDAKVKLKQDNCSKYDQFDLEDYQEACIRLSKTCKSYRDTFNEVTEQNIKLEEMVNKYKQKVEELKLKLDYQVESSYLSRKEEVRIQNIQNELIVDDLEDKLNDKDDVIIELQHELKDVKKTLSLSNLDRSFMEESLERSYDENRDQEFEIERLKKWLNGFEDSNTELIKVKKLLEQEKIKSVELESKLAENENKQNKLSTEWSIQYDRIKYHSIDLEKNLNKKAEEYLENSKNLKSEIVNLREEVTVLENTIHNTHRDLNSIANMKLDTPFENCLTKIEEVFRTHHEKLVDQELVHLSEDSDSDSCHSVGAFDDYETIHSNVWVK